MDEGKNKRILKNKMGRPPPNWLFHLSTGEYTVQVLEKISKSSARSVIQKMNKYAKYVTLIKINGKKTRVYGWNAEYFFFMKK